MFVISFWNGLTGLVPSVIAYAETFNHEGSNPTLDKWLLMILNGVLNFIFVLMLTFSYKVYQGIPIKLGIQNMYPINIELYFFKLNIFFQLDDASTISLVTQSLGIIFAFLIQIFVFDNIPNSMSIIGFVIVGICVIVSGVRKVISVKSSNAKVRKVLCLPIKTPRNNEKPENDNV